MQIHSSTSLSHNPVIIFNTENIQNTGLKKLFQINIFFFRKMTIVDDREPASRTTYQQNYLQPVHAAPSAHCIAII
jgi:hypothetical protein